MVFVPDLHDWTPVDRGSHVRAIGWLGGVHLVPMGRVPRDFVEKLDDFVEKCGDSISALEWVTWRGDHLCELCNEHTSALNLGVPAGEILYIAPEMISHYIREHAYCPPQAFIDAVLSSPVPGRREYANAVSSFRELNIQRLKKEFGMSGPRVQYLRQAAIESMRQGGGDSTIKLAALRILGCDDSDTTGRITKYIELMTKLDSRPLKPT